MPKILLLVLVIILLVTTGVGLKRYTQPQVVLGQNVEIDPRIEKLESQINYWEQIASSSPTYRDAYVQLANLHSQLGNTDQAKVYISKVLEIDPNWLAPTQLSSLLP